MGNTALVSATSEHRTSLLEKVAARFSMEPAKFLETIKKTVFPSGKEATNEQLAAFLAVCQEYELNPFLKEIYAFPARSGGIQPIVSIDGWLKIINRHPQYDGMAIEEIVEDGKLIAVKCTIFRKDRPGYPTSLTQWMHECFRETEPWKQMPSRMLTHKAVKEAGRYAFGFSGIQDEDEAIDTIARETAEDLPAPIMTPRRMTVTSVEPLRVEPEKPAVSSPEPTMAQDPPMMPRRKSEAREPGAEG